MKTNQIEIQSISEPVDSINTDSTKGVGVGTFFGIGVGPGPAGLIPVAAWQALKNCQVIFTPRASSKDQSVAKQCLEGLGIEETKFREIIYNMDTDRDA